MRYNNYRLADALPIMIVDVLVIMSVISRLDSILYHCKIRELL
ncbi:hypothetical protein RU87_GL001488 [Lactococcus plantarum]|uniref:Uncharacterized protein n=1 Tax=Pseudolactococcus plantarum TaxID=1365 RepID=A0A2A5RZJ9_9LACT|nr:hypothetical protein RU87_GL001488 [Lactococcus plantarum]